MNNTIDICFDSNTYSVLKFVSGELGIREVCYLPDFLSIGDISVVEPAARKKELLRYAGSDVIPDDFDELYLNSIRKLSCSKEVRAWSSLDEHEIMGLGYVASTVSEGTKIKRAYVPKPNIDTSFEELVGKYINSSKEAKPINIDDVRSEWLSLVSENSQLRVVENGVITSVDESYFDQQIIESARLFGSDKSASSIAMDINVRREKATGSMFCFYFLASRTMKIIPNIRL